MSSRRLKRVGAPAHYHCYNRLGGPLDDYPFTDEDREKAFELAREMSEFYLSEVIALVVLDNHWHAVLYVPSELPDKETVIERYNKYYGREKSELPSDKNWQDLAKRMVDVSAFMGYFQQRFSSAFNKRIGRKGAIWRGRFKSTLLDEQGSLWAAVKYVELNPFRAGIDAPLDPYSYSTWGRYQKTGKHPFMANFTKHMLKGVNNNALKGDDDLLALFGSRMHDTEEMESGRFDARKRSKMTPEEILAEEKERMASYYDFSRNLIYGGILGTEKFVRKNGREFDDKDRVDKKQLARSYDPVLKVFIYCYKRLRPRPHKRRDLYAPAPPLPEASGS